MLAFWQIESITVLLPHVPQYLNDVQMRLQALAPQATAYAADLRLVRAPTGLAQSS